MRGKFVIALIGLVALAAAGFGWWVNYTRAAQCRKFWGVEGASAVRFAKRIDALKLKREAAQAEMLMIDETDFTITETIDISERRGLMNARYSLLQDAGYDWSAEKSGPIKAEVYAIRFHGEKSVVTAVIEPSSGRIVYGETGRSAQLNAKAASGWQIFFSRIFPEKSPSPTKTK